MDKDNIARHNREKGQSSSRKRSRVEEVETLENQRRLAPAIQYGNYTVNDDTGNTETSTTENLDVVVRDERPSSTDGVNNQLTAGTMEATGSTTTQENQSDDTPQLDGNQPVATVNSQQPSLNDVQDEESRIVRILNESDPDDIHDHASTNESVPEQSGEVDAYEIVETPAEDDEAADDQDQPNNGTPEQTSQQEVPHPAPSPPQMYSQLPLPASHLHNHPHPHPRYYRIAYQAAFNENPQEAEWQTLSTTDVSLQDHQEHGYPDNLIHSCSACLSEHLRRIEHVLRILGEMLFVSSYEFGPH
ncbi:hypothetical protein BDB00DRAFT_787191 [Zychaea mexicana]|uniref:uncharacterized protein n=1 Tax=Zychaea mexicana TaxID=64656 RepID=UPI0022FF158A|nr:uncharacterized protein BDB00DRAFT_787191 [Zychaea mexicana]KAI9494344.1 hypothetical protein BDB00DRAFT_787191 [Zychaea mexicana]